MFTAAGRPKAKWHLARSTAHLKSIVANEPLHQMRRDQKWTKTKKTCPPNAHQSADDIAHRKRKEKRGAHEKRDSPAIIAITEIVK